VSSCLSRGWIMNRDFDGCPSTTRLWMRLNWFSRILLLPLRTTSQWRFSFLFHPLNVFDVEDSGT